MISPLVCGDPGCSFPYSQGVYTPGIMGSVLDHSLKQGTNGAWQYGSTATAGLNGVITAFNGEVANGIPKSTDITCISGTILLKPTPSSPASTALTNTGGCGPGYASYDEHPGYDYRANYNTPVYAVASGAVLNINGVRCINTNLPNGCATWGYVGILHPNGYISQYGHLNTQYIVTPGQSVNQGQLIGYSSDTGVPGFPHLHFEVLKQVGGIYYVVDPYGWVGVGNDPLYSRTVVPPQKLWQ